jgi:hypothetical protein
LEQLGFDDESALREDVDEMELISIGMKRGHIKRLLKYFGKFVETFQSTSNKLEEDISICTPQASLFCAISPASVKYPTMSYSLKVDTRKSPATNNSIIRKVTPSGNQRSHRENHNKINDIYKQDCFTHGGFRISTEGIEKIPEGLCHLSASREFLAPQHIQQGM